MQRLDILGSLILELRDESYLHNDQPTTCPKCGSRSNEIFDVSHLKEYGEIHRCLNKKCKLIFIMSENVEDVINELKKTRSYY